MRTHIFRQKRLAVGASSYVKETADIFYFRVKDKIDANYMIN